VSDAVGEESETRGAAQRLPRALVGGGTLPACARLGHARLAAHAAAGCHRAGVLYANQYASGGSFLAGLEGEITPGTGAELIVRIGVPPMPGELDTERALLGAVIAGIEKASPEHRPAGTLELTRFFIHPADFILHRWTVAVSMLCRLLRAEMTTLLDRSATDAELWAAFERSLPET